MRDQRVITCTYYIESSIPPEKAALILAGEQSSGTFIPTPGESDRIRERHAARVVAVRELGERPPSLPSRSRPDNVMASEIMIEFPMENVGTDVATLLTTVAGNLFELGDLFACRLQTMTLPDEYIAAHAGPAFGIKGTRSLIGDAQGVLVGTIIKPNVGLSEDEFRHSVRELAGAAIDLIKDDELMTNPAYLPLEARVRIATEEIRDAEQRTGHPTMYAFNITGDLAGLQARHDLVVESGGRCVMLSIPIMGLPALSLLRSFATVPIHGHRAGLAASMRHPGLGVDYTVWQQLARLGGADHVHVSGLGSKFYERDDQVAANIRSLQAPLGTTAPPVPTLSSGQNIFTAEPTFRTIGSTDLMMLAGGGVAAHPSGPAAGVRSLRDAWAAAVAGTPLDKVAAQQSAAGDDALSSALTTFGGSRDA